MVSGTIDGTFTQFYPNGEPFHQIVMSRGHLQAMMTFYSDGTLATFLTYKNDAAAGTTAVYFPSGRIHQLTEYSDGRLDGSDFLYLRNGEQLVETKWKMGQKTGESAFREKTERESAEIKSLLDQSSPKEFQKQWDKALLK
jgi:antitoxin component YwqK of YwqJK toxin-antitoxin module